MTQVINAPMAGEKKTERFEMKIEPSLLTRLKRQASRFSMGDSAYVRRAIIERLERDEATDPDLQDSD